jgi:hypothetical protein
MALTIKLNKDEEKMLEDLKIHIGQGHSSRMHYFMQVRNIYSGIRNKTVKKTIGRERARYF